MLFLYKCSSCDKKYTESRDSADPQFFTNCDICGSLYVEDN